MSARIGTSTDKIEIECAEILGADSPAHGDLLLLVSVQSGEFSGRVDTWVDQASWSDFLRQLQELEQRRQGSATLESISPGELCLTVKSTDRTGHMAIHGLIGVRGATRELRLEFSPIPFEPSELAELLREISKFGRA